MGVGVIALFAGRFADTDRVTAPRAGDGLMVPTKSRGHAPRRYPEGFDRDRAQEQDGGNKEDEALDEPAAATGRQRDGRRRGLLDYWLGGDDAGPIVNQDGRGLGRDTRYET